MKIKHYLLVAVVVVGAAVAAAVVASLPPPATAVRVAAAGAAPCPAGDLRLASLRTGAASGTVYYTVTLTNAGAGSCRLAGFPTFALHGKDGRSLPTRVSDGVPSLSAPETTAPVVVSPGGRASVTLSFAADPADAGGCPPASGLSIALPGGGSVMLPVELGPCQGRLQTTPFVAGSPPLR
jgi:hypothetical protein